MLKNKLVLSAVAALFCVQVSYAMPPKPAKCPSTSAIQAVGVSHDVYEKEPGRWIAFQPHENYETPDTWTFAVGIISAKNATEAYNKATESLSHLHFQIGPIAQTRYKLWMCGYSAGHYQAVAVNPAVEMGLKTSPTISNLF